MDETLANLRMTFCQEETDTKIIVHLSDCIRSGHDNVIVNTAYTDVVTLVLAYQPYFKRPCHIIIDFNFGSNRGFYDINKIGCSIPTDVLPGLMFFYVFTGSDVTSSFYQLSKVTWWNLWCNNIFITPVFSKLSWTPRAITESDFTDIERFVCMAYDPQKRFNVTDINKL